MAPARKLGFRDPRWPFQASRLLAALQRVRTELEDADDWPAVHVDAALLLGEVLWGSGAPADVIMSVLGPRATGYCRAVAAARAGRPIALRDDVAVVPSARHHAGGQRAGGF
jgi:hypothetical protein